MKKTIYLSILLLLAVTNAFAQQVVSTNTDDGAGSLRAAITAGNSTSAPYSITFTTAGPISLTAALPEITQSCTIIGKNSLVPATATGGTTIERSTTAANFRIFKAVTPDINLSFQDLILQNGVAITDANVRGGGALLAELGSGNLTMTRCLVSNCSAINNKEGGGVHLVTGSAQITDCQFSTNTALTGGGFKSGIYIVSPNPNPVNLLRCTFNSNQTQLDGGGIFINGGTATLTNCTFSSNRGDDPGSAIYASHTSAPISLIHCSFFNNYGEAGTIATSQSSPASFSVVNCLFVTNTSTHGTGNFKLFGNPITSLGGNVSTDDADLIYLNQSGSDKVGVNIAASPLQQNNGGLVSTHSIENCSPARDAGVSSVTLPPTDANNQARLGLPDAGAYEVQTNLSSVAGSITVSGPASCTSSARLTAPATGTSFIFTGPGGYVFSNVYRTIGNYPAFAEGIKLGGTYTLTVSSGEGCPTTTSTVVVQGPSSCP